MADRAKAKSRAQSRKKGVSMRKEHKNSEGGLNQKGRDYYNKKTGSNLKARNQKAVSVRSHSVPAWVA